MHTMVVVLILGCFSTTFFVINTLLKMEKEILNKKRLKDIYKIRKTKSFNIFIQDVV